MRTRRTKTDRVVNLKTRSRVTWFAIVMAAGPLPYIVQAQTIEWAASAGGASRDYGTDIAVIPYPADITVDLIGNSFVTGAFLETATFGSFTLESAGMFDMFIARYDANGDVLWVRSGTGTSQHFGSAVAVSSAGHSYVTGAFGGTADFEHIRLTSAGTLDILVAKYDPNGNVLWARSAGGDSAFGDRGLAIAVNEAGSSYVTGTYNSPATFGTIIRESVGSRGDDIFVAKYDTNGNVLWVRSAGGDSQDTPRAIAVDLDGNSYVTGIYQLKATFKFGTVLSSAGHDDMFVAKYDTNGAVLWARSAGGSRSDEGTDIAIDATGNSYVTGFYSGTPSFGSISLPDAGYQYNAFLAKYGTAGTLLWAKQIGNDSVNIARTVAVDTEGHCYVSGTYFGTALFGPFSLTSTDASDSFVAKFDASGTVLWVRSTTSSGSEHNFVRRLAVDTFGKAYLIGDYEGEIAFGTDYLASVGDRDIFVAKYSGPECGDGNIDPDEECDDAGGSRACNADCTFSVCGDSTVNEMAKEECDGGTACTDCRCHAGFGPTNPPTIDCQPTCGNDRLDPGEQCDGGVQCAGCLCAEGFEPTTPPSPDCQLPCGNGRIDIDEECDGGIGCTDCLCAADFEPTIPPAVNCMPTCGNGRVDPEEQCDGSNDTACPAACRNDCICGSFCGDNACDPSEDSCNCPTDCGTPPSTETAGSTCIDSLDNDCDGLIDSYDPDCESQPIPAASEWGLAVIALALLAVARVLFRKRHSAAVYQA